MKTSSIRRVFQYIIGLFIMALGIVLIKKADLGMSAISTVPAAISNIVPKLTLGNTTIMFHIAALIAIVIITRKIDIPTLILIPLAFGFGYIIDMYMFLLQFGHMHLIVRILLSFIGTVVSALGITTIGGANLFLPSPDGFMQTISKKLDNPLSKVKMCGDAIWVAATVIIELIAYQKITIVGIGTLISVLFAGKFIGIFKKALPWLQQKA